jgi:hypothetical protein
MTDRTAKALLLAVALGLWANVATLWIGPVPVFAQDNSDIVRELRSIKSSVESITSGLCLNSKIC